jgi:hypothetical protein
MDNSRIDKSKSAIDEMANIRVLLARHPPDSPDLAPSDFSFVGYLKEKMIRLGFDSPKDLIAWSKATFEAIPK